MAPARSRWAADWFQELEPPKQNPTVNTDFTAPPSFDFKYAIAAPTSAAMFSGVVFCTCGM